MPWQQGLEDDGGPPPSSDVAMATGPTPHCRHPIISGRGMNPGASPLPWQPWTGPLPPPTRRRCHGNRDKHRLLASHNKGRGRGRRCGAEERHRCHGNGAGTGEPRLERFHGNGGRGNPFATASHNKGKMQSLPWQRGRKSVLGLLPWQRGPGWSPWRRSPSHNNAQPPSPW